MFPATFCACSFAPSFEDVLGGGVLAGGLKLLLASYSYGWKSLGLLLRNHSHRAVEVRCVVASVSHTSLFDLQKALTGRDGMRVARSVIKGAAGAPSQIISFQPADFRYFA